jgi:hypothetical protein
MSKQVRAQNEHEIQPENTIVAFSVVDLFCAHAPLKDLY